MQGLWLANFETLASLHACSSIVHESASLHMYAVCKSKEMQARYIDLTVVSLCQQFLACELLASQFKTLDA